MILWKMTVRSSSLIMMEAGQGSGQGKGQARGQGQMPLDLAVKRFTRKLRKSAINYLCIF